MANVVIYKQLQKLKEELNRKVDELKFRIALEDLANEVNEIKDKVELVSELDSDRVDKLLNAIKDYEDKLNETNVVLVEEVNQALKDSGIIDRLRDEILSKIEETKNEIINNLTVPRLLKDVPLTEDGYIDLGIEIIDILDFEIPIYRYENNNIVVYCYVSPVLTEDGKIHTGIDEKIKEEFGLDDSLKNYMASLQVLIKLNKE
jgi:Asp-tRNA(Asn)/Glu-tRNA(Gln) amidotransferase C subunit